MTKSSGASDKKGAAGGSFGIGKFAPFACSDFYTVFYSTYDENEERAYQGVSRLVTFTRDDGNNTQGVGYFGEERNIPVYDEIHLDNSFNRQHGEHGTDIYIAGYKFNDGNIKDLTNLQRIAIICMKQINRDNSLNNKAFLVVD